MLIVSGVVVGVGSLIGLLFAAQVEARQVADANRAEVVRQLRG